MKKIKYSFVLSLLLLQSTGCLASESAGVPSALHCAPMVSFTSALVLDPPTALPISEEQVLERFGALHPELLNKRFIVRVSQAALEQVRTESVGEHLARDLAGEPRLSRIDESMYTLEFDRERSSSEIAALLHAGDYDYVEPDFEVFETTMPDDPQIAKQWAHGVVQSSKAWDISRGGEGVVVAVLDSGIDINHPDLAGNIWTRPPEAQDPQDPSNSRNGGGDQHSGDIHGWNFAANNSDVLADDAGAYHGTHVAGTIGAVGNNGIGISGHAQVVKLMPLKFIGSQGAGYTSDAVRGIDYAIAHHVQIINNSWGSPFDSEALSSAIRRARDAGILFVAAAGNSGTDNDTTPFYPASYPYDNIIRVAASDQTDHLARWSNFGAHGVDLAAPGVNILSTKNGNQYQYLSGTSMATPLVSGVLATMVALRPDLSYRQIKKALLESVDILPIMGGKILSQGRINSYRALLALKPMRPLLASATDSGPCLPEF